MGMGVVGRLAGDVAGQGLRFAVVGSLATVVQLGLYAFLSGSVGAQLANICSWLVATLVANAAHQRVTFRRSRSRAESDQLFGLLTSLTGLGLSSFTLAVLDQPAGLAGTLALVGVNATVGVLRFVALRWWLVVRPALRPAAPGELREPRQGLQPCRRLATSV
jgi:putative flippase GtrA